MGRGNRVWFWEDCWVLGSEVLSIHILEPLSEGLLGRRVADFVMDNGQWNWNLFSHLLDNMSVMRIAVVKPHSFDNVLDFLCWKGARSGNFTTTSTYAMLAEDNWFPTSHL